MGSHFTVMNWNCACNSWIPLQTSDIHKRACLPNSYHFSSARYHFPENHIWLGANLGQTCSSQCMFVLNHRCNQAYILMCWVCESRISQSWMRIAPVIHKLHFKRQISIKKACLLNSCHLSSARHYFPKDHISPQKFSGAYIERHQFLKEGGRCGREKTFI